MSCQVPFLFLNDIQILRPLAESSLRPLADSELITASDFVIIITASLHALVI
ncbi:MAG: hypothetical protein AAB209_01655 [Bacteroidota bacterium]